MLLCRSNSCLLFPLFVKTGQEALNSFHNPSTPPFFWLPTAFALISASGPFPRALLFDGICAHPLHNVCVTHDALRHVDAYSHILENTLRSSMQFSKPAEEKLLEVAVYARQQELWQKFRRWFLNCIFGTCKACKLFFLYVALHYKNLQNFSLKIQMKCYFAIPFFKSFCVPKWMI